MKIQLTLIAVSTSLLLASNLALAESKHERRDRHDRQDKHEWREHPTIAPEISIASGTSAIALLAAALLLMGERVRTRRS